MSTKLIEMFEKKLKSGKVEEFRKYLIQNNLKDEFINECFVNSYNGITRSGKSEKLWNDLSNFEMILLKEDFEMKFGKNVSNKLFEIIDSNNSVSTRNFWINGLNNKNVKARTIGEQKQMLNLLEMGSDERFVMGTHVIGASKGFKLMNGIALTGHKFIANDGLSYRNDLKMKLSENITFFENNPIDFMLQGIRARKYNNYGDKYNDTMLVAIPREELERNSRNVVRSENGNNYLNPEYIAGFSRNDVNRGDFAGMYINQRSKFMENNANRLRKRENIDWNKKLENWYYEANTTKFSKIKNKITNFFRGTSKSYDKNMYNNEKRYEGR